MIDAGYWMLGIGYWVLVTGLKLELDAGSWSKILSLAGRPVPAGHHVKN